MTRKRSLAGFADLAPALLFVLAFTAYPFLQMAWVSLHDCSLLSPPRFVGPANYERGVTTPGSGSASA